MITTVENMTIKYFDTLEYVTESKRIKDAGGNVDEFQVRQIEAAIETAVQSVKKDAVTRNDLKNFATKDDIFRLENNMHKQEGRLEGKIKDLRYDTLKFVVWTGVAVIATLGGMGAALGSMIARGFHWL